MRLRLKEDPREWRKFSWALSGALVVVASLIIWKNRAMEVAPVFAIGLALVVFVVGSLRPRVFRPVYRGAMRFSHAMGQVMGRVLLTLFFVLLITPLGLALRMGGKRVLQMGVVSGDRGKSYWIPAKKPGPLERLF